MFIVDLFLQLILSVLINFDTFSWVRLKIVCGTYTNRTFIFSSPSWLKKVMARVTVVCACLFTSIDCFGRSKIYFKFITQELIFIDDLFILNLLDQRSLVLKLVPECDFKLFVGNMKIRHMNFLPLQFSLRLRQGGQLCDWTYYHKLFYCIPNKHIKAYLFIIVRTFFNRKRINTEIGSLIYQYHNHNT